MQQNPTRHSILEIVTIPTSEERRVKQSYFGLPFVGLRLSFRGVCTHALYLLIDESGPRRASGHVACYSIPESTLYDRLIATW